LLNERPSIYPNSIETAHWKSNFPPGSRRADLICYYLLARLPNGQAHVEETSDSRSVRKRTLALP
jgi:hypothetical protein